MRQATRARLHRPSQAFTCLLVLLLAASQFTLPAPATKAQADGSLLVNAGFEQGASSWDLCGTAEIVDAQSPGTTAAMVYAGRRALRLTYSDAVKCGSPVFDPDGAAVQSISIPADAPAVTVSFWYSRVGNPTWPVKVSLAEPGGFGYLTELEIDNLGGWHLFRYELTASQLEAVRGRNVDLELASEFSTATDTVPQTERPGFYIDEVRVVAAVERTAEAPRPPELRGDGTGPIVYLDAERGGIARMDADGGGARLIYQGATTPLSPVWSAGGGRIAVIQGWLTPESSTDPLVNPAQISVIYSFGASGGGARELYRTGGIPGYRPAVPTPGDPERPALDVTASQVAWAPDDRTIALALCAQNRYKSGSVTDPACWIELIDVASGASRGKVEPGFAPSWSALGRILYSNEDGYQSKPTGIYEIDPGTTPPAEQLLVPGTGGQFDPSGHIDRSPAWSPDGSRFATIRAVDGYHYDEQGAYVVHYGLMLFERDTLLARQILLIDHGRSPGNLAWSPDGAFILYTLYQGDSADIWWLDTRTGLTGRLTGNGASVAASWRPTALAPQAFLPLLR